MADISSHSCDVFGVLLLDRKLNLLYYRTTALGTMPLETAYQLVDLMHIPLPKVEPQILWIIRREGNNISRNISHLGSRRLSETTTALSINLFLASVSTY